MSSTSKKLMGITPVSGAVEAQAIDFDGTNDYLSRSTDLVGNADGKTFTFSAWVYVDVIGSDLMIYSGNDGPTLSVRIWIDATGVIEATLRNSSNSDVIEVRTNNAIPEKTWMHLSISCDATSTSNRHFFINDEAASVTWVDYNNDIINFTNPDHGVGQRADGFFRFDGRLSNVYLDYTYRDLSVEANRRLFVDYDDDGGLIPASGQASLSPILYLPMDDPDDPGRNDGTGGDFTLNGTIARSGRGPNQYNAPASTFDGSADYLSKLGISATDGNTFTYRIVGKTPLTKSEYQITTFVSGGAYRFQFRWSQTSGDIVVFVRNSANTVILNFTLAGAVVANKYADIAFSVDLSDPAKRHVFVDGVDRTSSVTWSTYVDDSAGLNGTDVYVGGDNIAAKSDGQLSSVYFDTTYIDLSADNPFYDTETGKPKFLGENGELPTGSSPLIYLPLRADDAGNNKGTGGDFTVNSGPYVGARGPSEFWSGSAEFNGTDNYLRNAGFTSPDPSPSAISIAFAFKTSGTSSTDGVQISWDFLNGRESYFEADSQSGFASFRVFIADDSGTYFSSGTVSHSFLPNEWYSVLIFCDGGSGTAKLYIDGVEEASDTFTPTTFESVKDMYIGRDAGGNYKEGSLGFFWFGTEYIDFSQEANRLKFFDAFNYPVDLGEDGSLPTGNQPLIYLNKDFHLGTNLGSGGDFTPVNGPTDGGFVKG